jgi:ferrochelatase
LLVLSQALAAKIAEYLARNAAQRYQVELAMSYGNPTIGAAVQRFAQAGIARLLVLPLYPQYSSSTTAAVFDAITQELSGWRCQPALHFVNQYFDQDPYAAVLADSIRAHWAAKGGPQHLVFSFHGIPQRYVDEGDPYYAQALATAGAAADKLGLSKEQYTIAFQSRFGPVQWIKPYTEQVLRDLAERKILKVSVVSPSFAVDCLETLDEVACEYRDLFTELGGQLELVPALNASDPHAEFLAKLVVTQCRGWD